MAAEPSKKRVIKKVDGGHGHHGGAWKVAYADFVTAMMALFMVMWLLASTDQQTREEIASYFRTGILPEGDLAMNHAAQSRPAVIEQAMTPPPPGGQTLEEEAESLAKAMKEMLAGDEDLAALADQVSVKATPEGIVVDLVGREDDDLLFDSSSASLKPQLEEFIGLMAPSLARTGRTMEIRGHTDARPFSARASTNNWDLSYSRAAAARGILERGGVPAGQMGSVVARGATEPYDPARPYAASNRRLSILLKNKAGAAAEPGADPEADGDAPADVAPAAATPGRRPGR